MNFKISIICSNCAFITSYILRNTEYGTVLASVKQANKEVHKGKMVCNRCKIHGKYSTNITYINNVEMYDKLLDVFKDEEISKIEQNGVTIKGLKNGHIDKLNKIIKSYHKNLSMCSICDNGIIFIKTLAGEKKENCPVCSGNGKL